MLINLSDNQTPTNNGVIMKLLFIIACLIACIISGAANAWPLPKVGVEGKIEQMNQYTWVKEHVRTHEPEYVFNDVNSIVDRIQIPEKPKNEERYYGK